MEIEDAWYDGEEAVLDMLVEGLSFWVDGFYIDVGLFVCCGRMWMDMDAYD